MSNSGSGEDDNSDEHDDDPKFLYKAQVSETPLVDPREEEEDDEEEE